MSHVTCATMEELAAELALGVVDGEARAHALEHLSACTECRALVDEMSRAADELLLLAPQTEPPIGFESRVLARVARRRRVSWRWVAVAAVLAAVCSAVTGVVVNASGSDARTDAARYQRLVRALGGRTLRAVDLRSLDGTTVGKVYAYDGKPSWLFLVLEDRSGSGQYQVELDPISGEAIKLAGFQMRAGRASWATTAAIAIDEIQSVSIVDSTGTPLYSSEFQTPQK